MPKLTLDDIADLRAYERERDDFRREVIALKKRRRVAVGPFLTLLFENDKTIRFQIQEMARAEKLMTDEQIQTELDIYNPLIPEPGMLCATLFLELTSDEELRRWLPELVGIERAVELRASGRVMPAQPEEEHDKALTRDDVTASVHYLHWRLDADDIEAVEGGGVELVTTHPSYEHTVQLDDETVRELLDDLHG